MKRFGIFVFSALASSLAAWPAFASWDRVGSVGFSMTDTYESEYRNFTGDALDLKAQNSDVDCQSVTAVYANGSTRLVFHGPLPRGRDVAVGLPEPRQNVIRLDFNCRPARSWGGRVQIAAGDGEHAPLMPAPIQASNWRSILARLF
jgi:hypothetical protein